MPKSLEAAGATVIEKHFTLDCSLPGPDHAASLEPHELEAMVKGILTAQMALGTGEKRPADSEKGTADVARKSLVAAKYIPAGTVLTEELIAIKRPGTGLSPAMKTDLVGKSMQAPIAAGALFKLEMLVFPEPVPPAIPMRNIFLSIIQKGKEVNLKWFV